MCFFHALTLQLRDAMMRYGYELPNPATLATKSWQIDELLLPHLCTVQNSIQFRVFCREYCRAYVSTSVDEKQSIDMIISDCTKALQFIKIQY